MSFHLYFLCGLLGGIFGGMGMGGGTLLIPLLTVLCGVDQTAAQGVNLLAFLPMSLIALSVHVKNGLVRREGVLPLVLPAACFSVLGALTASVLPPQLLRKGFGLFLTGLSVSQFSGAVRTLRAEHRKKAAG